LFHVKCLRVAGVCVELLQTAQQQPGRTSALLRLGSTLRSPRGGRSRPWVAGRRGGRGITRGGGRGGYVIGQQQQQYITRGVYTARGRRSWHARGAAAAAAGAATYLRGLASCQCNFMVLSAVAVKFMPVRV